MQIRNLPRDLQERAWEYNQRAKESWVLKASSFTEFLNISLIDAFYWVLAEEGGDFWDTIYTGGVQSGYKLKPLRGQTTDNYPIF